MELTRVYAELLQEKQELEERCQAQAARIEAMQAEQAPGMEAHTRALIMKTFYQAERTKNGKSLRPSVRFDHLSRALKDDCNISFTKLSLTVKLVCQALLSGNLEGLSFPGTDTLTNHYIALVHVMQTKALANTYRPRQPLVISLDSSVRDGTHLVIYRTTGFCFRTMTPVSQTVHTECTPTTSAASHLQGITYIKDKLGLNIAGLMADNTNSMSGKEGGIVPLYLEWFGVKLHL